MKESLLSSVLLLATLSSCAQSDNSQLSAIAGKLEQKELTVSDVLTDPQYLGLHPLTGFRELIRDHCSTGIIAIAPATEPGKRIRVTGQVVNTGGLAIPNALVYLYQTDARGWYAAESPHVQAREGDMRQARLFGYIRTDGLGKFELHTIKPAGYPQSDLPAHIHVHVWAEGYAPFVNEFLFDDDERLKGRIREEAVRNRFLIQKPQPANLPFSQQFDYTIRLSKENTP